MALRFRRVVTGHDDSGRAVVKIDEIAKNLVSARPGATASVVWTTEGFPVNNDDAGDEGSARPASHSTTARSSAFSSLLRASARATTTPILSTMPWSCRARSTWCSTIPRYI